MLVRHSGRLVLVLHGVLPPRGPVKWHYEDGLGNGYEAVITAKNI